MFQDHPHAQLLLLRLHGGQADALAVVEVDLVQGAVAADATQQAGLDRPDVAYCPQGQAKVRSLAQVIGQGAISVDGDSSPGGDGADDDHPQARADQAAQTQPAWVVAGGGNGRQGQGAAQAGGCG